MVAGDLPGFCEVAHSGALNTLVFGERNAQRHGVIACVEVDCGLFLQSRVAPSRDPEQAAKRRDRTGLQAGQVANFITAGEPQAPNGLALSDPLAGQTQVRRHDNHDEAPIGFADQRLGSACEGGSSDFGGLLAGEDRCMVQPLKINAIRLEFLEKVLQDGHFLF